MADQFEPTYIPLERADLYSYETKDQATFADLGETGPGTAAARGVIVDLGVAALSVDVDVIEPGLITLSSMTAEHPNPPGIVTDFDVTPAAARALASELVRAAAWVEQAVRDGE